ncbi:aryl-sulfate sulfotransferase [Winogradskyella ursingii]|uniref:aryl-sulfate sulfotransferase n=1 Tax=Winogradskyella ursingii TaxID=2686079 RepID=UPI0015C6A946|nr:aryl-sulfate sulfotransferase [Winogradskyella ursingii]
MKLKLLFFFPLLILLIGKSTVFAQETVGLLYNDQNNVADGYTLFSPLTNSDTYLIDNCGQVVNQWSFNGTPRAVPYLLEDGTILRSGSEGIELRDWDNTLLWSFNLVEELNLRQHHDIEPMPNGNILAIVREFISVEEQINLGKNPALVDDVLRSEKIMEFKPIGTNDIQIIWEWRFADRLIQDFDSSKANFGNVADHPERIDFNYEDYNMSHEDWIHMNGIDYNSDLDQIIMSCKSLGEIYIIDHSTTTAEAASHSGGNYNKGGDFIWRWGNPEVYRQGTSADRKLFEQHDPKWIPKNYPNEDKISVFNNDVGATQTHSSVNILTPVPTLTGYEMTNDKFSPSEFFFSWDGEIRGETFYQPTRSGVTALPNGNLIFCESSKGQLVEINPSGDIVWVYRNPSGQSSIIDQFSSEEEITTNVLFRAEKYPSNYSGFNGKDLTPGNIIEDVNSNSEACNEALSVSDSDLIEPISLLYNPIEDNTVFFNSQLHPLTLLNLYHIDGKLIMKNVQADSNKFYLPQIEKGIYFIVIKNHVDNKTQTIKFIKN